MNRRRQWDIFCKVIDNHGDIGVCWRLSAELAARGQQVRLWVDDASALGWMAPAGVAGVQVLAWTAPLKLQAAGLASCPADIVMEAFGCDIASEFIAHITRVYSAGGLKPLWINLEHLSAEAYATRCHALPSPVLQGPAAGWTKYFFYPGFTPATGGLLRETNWQARFANFDRVAWLAQQGMVAADALLVSLFCYEPSLLAPLLAQWSSLGHAGRPVRLLVASGRASSAVKRALQSNAGAGSGQQAQAATASKPGSSCLTVTYLPWLTQVDFDHLLWACDLNFVRGEDSLVRALWAGKPFVWQLYPQDDQAHQAKLEAFLDALTAPASLRDFHHNWNAPDEKGMSLRLTSALGRTSFMSGADLDEWRWCAQAARSRLQQQDDLVSRLLSFANENR